MIPFKKLEVWQKAHEFTLDVYKLTAHFPKGETYGIVSQLRRASSSIPANIVEGYSRKGTKEFVQFLFQARASLYEAIYFLLLSKDLSYLEEKEYKELVDRGETLGKMLNAFIKSLEGRDV